MRKRSLLTLIGVLMFQSLWAQQAYTLQQCVDYALKNHLTIKSSEYDAKTSRAKRNEVIGQGLPQVTANFQLMHNDPLRRMFFPNTPGTPFFQQSAPPGEVISTPNFFQAPTSGDLNAQVSQLLLSSSYIVGVKGAKTYIELANQGVFKTKVDVVEGVSKAYWLSVAVTERMNLLDQNIARIDSNLRQLRATNKSGFAESIDVSRLEVTFNNLLAEKQKSQALQEASIAGLKYRMGMPLTEELAPSESLKDAAVKYVSLDSSDVDYNSRIEYQLLKTNQKLNNYDLKLKKYEILPTISLFGAMGWYNQTMKPVDYLNKSTPWYQYGNYGLNVAAPLVTGSSRHYKVQQAMLKIKKTENDMKYLEQSINFEVYNAKVSYDNSLKTVEINKKNMDLAAEVSRVINIKFKNGLASNLEVTVAENELKDAQTNYYISVSDALLARIDYDKSKGTLYKEQ